MKKILGLTVAALLVIGLVGGGTWAYFSDTETVSSNTFTAGTLDLDLDGGSVASFSIANTYPSDNRPAADWTLDNNSTIPAAAWLEIVTSSITENDAQSDGAALDDYVQLLLWIDANGNDALNTGEVYLVDGGLATWGGTDGASPTSAEALLEYTEAGYLEGSTFGTAADPCATIPGGNSDNHFRVYFYFPDNALDQNDAQGDDFGFDITFTLYQQ